MNSTDPKESIALLNELVRCGFSNDFYRQLHHRPRDTINAHINYCNKTSEFREGETNAGFQSRLRFVRDAIETKYGADEKIDALRFQQLVNAALRRYPL
jgi:hypothetical protein